MPLLQKAFCIAPMEDKFGIGLAMQNSLEKNQTQYPQSTHLFNTKVNNLIF